MLALQTVWNIDWKPTTLEKERATHAHAGQVTILATQEHPNRSEASKAEAKFSDIAISWGSFLLVMGYQYLDHTLFSFSSAVAFSIRAQWEAAQLFHCLHALASI